MTRIAGAAMLAALLLGIVIATTRTLGWRQSLAVWSIATIGTAWLYVAATLLAGGTA
jgi:hypothetical protein